MLDSGRLRPEGDIVVGVADNRVTRIDKRADGFCLVDADRLLAFASARER